MYLTTLVITPVGKAAGNADNICKTFYAQVLVTELRLENQQIANTSTYLKICKTAVDIMDNHAKFLKESYISPFKMKQKTSTYVSDP